MVTDGGWNGGGGVGWGGGLWRCNVCVCMCAGGGGGGRLVEGGQDELVSAEVGVLVPLFVCTYPATKSRSSRSCL